MGLYMLPYIDIPPIHFGGFITLQPFGLLVVTGCLVGYGVGRWHAGSLGLDQRVFRSFTLWVLVPAFFMAHSCQTTQPPTSMHGSLGGAYIDLKEANPALGFPPTSMV